MNDSIRPRSSARHARAKNDTMVTPTLRAVAIVVVFSVLVAAYLGGTGTNIHHVATNTKVTTKDRTNPLVSLRLVDATNGASQPVDPSTPPPAAPSDYAATIEAFYSQAYSAATVLPNASANPNLTTPSQLENAVDALSPTSLGYLNEYLSSSDLSSMTSSVNQATPVEEHLAHALSVHFVHTLHASRNVAAASKAVAHILSAHNTVLNSLTNIPLVMPTDDPYTGDVSGNQYTSSCPDGSPGPNYGETSIFGVQIASEVASAAYNALSPGAGTDTPVGIGLYIASGVADAIILILAIVGDTLSYLQSIANDCQGTQMQQVGINTDNNTYQIYQLLTAVAGTANETDQNVANLTDQSTAQFQQQLKLSIEQALASPTTSVPLAQMELPVMYDGVVMGGYLDSQPVGVSEVVSDTITAMQATGQTISPQATRDLGLAQQAQAAGQFKLAFDYYRLAYQAAAG
jgi:hypothetical protein